METFFRRYLDSLVSAPRPTDETYNLVTPGRERAGYSFWERYWASLTRTMLLPKDNIPVDFETGNPARYFKPPRRKKLSLIFSSAVVAAALGVVAAGVVIGFLARPGEVPKGAVEPSVKPSITNGLPFSGIIVTAKQVPSFTGGNDIVVSGTARNILPGHQYWVFFSTSASGQAIYFPKGLVANTDGLWQGEYSLPNEFRGQLIIWFVDLGPDALHVLKRDTYAQNNGFPILSFAADVTVLDSTQVDVR